MQQELNFVLKPSFDMANKRLIFMQPKPYLHERRKFIELASLKYFAGADISPMRKLLKQISDKNSLSKIKSLSNF